MTDALLPASVDLVVSSYVLHHLADADKRALAAKAALASCHDAATSPPGTLLTAPVVRQA